MYVIGVVITGLISWWLAVLYLAYSLISNVLYMAWVCPYCGHYALGPCPAGFHILSARRFKPKLGRTFRGEFRRNLYVMVPGWFVPPLAGLFLLINSFSWSVLVLLVAFSMIHPPHQISVCINL